MALSDLTDLQLATVGHINQSISASSIPDGPDDVSLTHGGLMDPSPGDVIDASWTDTSTTLAASIEWWKNGSLWRIDNVGANVGGAQLTSSDTQNNFVQGDTLEARVFYTTTGTEQVVGTSLSGSASEFATHSNVNTNLDMQTALAGTTQWATKKDIIDNRRVNGTPGFMSNQLTFAQ